MRRLFVKSVVLSFALVVMGQLTMFSLEAHAARKEKKKSAPTQQQSALSTDIRFDASTVYGRYQFSDEALATVEDEKLLNNLLGVRMDFKDRLQAATKAR